MLRGLPFHEWAAVFERARVVVTVDTGATHVASAVGRPTLVAFEHRYFRLNSQEWSPYGVPHVLVRKPAREDDDSLARFRDEIVSGVARLLASCRMPDISVVIPTYNRLDTLANVVPTLLAQDLAPSRVRAARLRFQL